MNDAFFEKPILNSPYQEPRRHWELDKSRQPTQRDVDKRRPAEFITPIPKARWRQGVGNQSDQALGDAAVSTANQQCAHTAIINAVRQHAEVWRRIPSPNDGRVTPEH